MINNLKGGVGDNTSSENIDPNELSIGIQVEMEHTNDPNIAKEIATDHLTEDPEYYTKLVKAGLAKEFQPSASSGFGDSDLAINDKSRTGNHGYKSGNNIVGTIGNTSDGEVHGRRSNPIVNKTIDIELQEKKKSKKGKPKPTNPSLWARAKSMARSKFDVYPSAYANAWAAKWYKSKGGGWRMSECDCGCKECGDNKNPSRVFDSPSPAETSPEGLGTYRSGYDFVGYGENKDNITMKEQKLKQIIKTIIRKQLNENMNKPEYPGTESSKSESSDLPSTDSSENSESVTLTLDRETAQKLHDLLMNQLSSTEAPKAEAPEAEAPEAEAPEAEAPEAETPEAETPDEEAPDEENLGETEFKEGKKKKWIQKAISKPGALHKQLGVPPGEKIPSEKLKAAAKKGGKLGKRARLAMTLKKVSKKK